MPLRRLETIPTPKRVAAISTTLYGFGTVVVAAFTLTSPRRQNDGSFLVANEIVVTGATAVTVKLSRW